MANFETIAAEEQPQSILLFGASKTGKTELAGELANEGYRLIWIDLENGKQTLIHCVKPENFKNIEYVHVPDTMENPMAILTVGKLLQSSGPVRICDRHGVIACAICKENITTIDLTKLTNKDVVVIDTGTQLSDSALAYVMKEENRKMFTAFERADFDAYGHQGRLLNSVFSNFQNRLKCHRILITHESIIDQPDGSKLIMPKCGTKNYSREFPRFFDHVLYLYRSNKKHMVASSTEFSPKILTGSRSAIAIEKGAKLSDLLKAGEMTYAKAIAAGQIDKTADYGTPE